MTIDVVEKRMFLFRVPLGEIGVEIAMPAMTQSEAASKLIAGFERAITELRTMAKPGAN